MGVKKDTAMKTIPLNLFLLLAICIFIGGMVGGILLCGQVAHKGIGSSGEFSQEDRLASQIKKLTKLLESEPQNVEAWTQLGNFYFDSDKYEKAIEAYQKALSLAPNNPDVWTDLGIMYRSARMPEKALEAFDRAISIDAKHANARFNRGIVLMHDLKQEEAAIKVLEELSNISPTFETADGTHIDEVILYYKTKQDEKNRTVSK